MEIKTKESKYFSELLKTLTDYRWLWAKQIGRREYFKINATNFTIIIVLFFAGALVTHVSESLAGLMVAPYLIWFVVAFYVYAMSSLGRLNDLGMSRWSLLWFLVPFVWIFFFFYLFLKKGKRYITPTI